MEFTGERYIPNQHGNIELEHLHRYFCAAGLATGKDVLDIACGEGYGSAILARSARQVIGVDISTEAVMHARRNYVRHNLKYLVGSAAEIPLPDRSVDLVVSFETIEHHDQHDAMMLEIKRILRPGGLLLISSPERHVYSELPHYINPFHIKELNRDEFDALLRRYFGHVAFYGQRVIYGSVILAEDVPASAISYRRDGENTQSAKGLVDPMYLIALASDDALAPIASGVFEGRIEDIEALVAATERVRAQEVETSQLAHVLTQAHTDIEALNEVVNQKTEELRAAYRQIAEYDATARRHRVRYAELEALAARLRETAAHLQETAARLQEANAHLTLQAEAIRRSSSWRLTAPLRFTTTLSRRVGAAAMRRLRFLRSLGRPPLIPLNDLRALGRQEYLTTGFNPYFSIGWGRYAIRQGWAIVTMKVVDSERPLRPVLHAFGGKKGDDHVAFRLPTVTQGTVRKLIGLPTSVQLLRLDPIGAVGVRFSVTNVSVKNVSAIRSICHIFSEFSWTERKHFLVTGLLKGPKALRASVRKILSDTAKAEYRTWVDLYDTLTTDDHAAIRANVATMDWKPLISVVMPVYNPRPDYLRLALDSVIGQLYPNWELCIADDASTDPHIKPILDRYARSDSRIKVVYRSQNGHVSAATNSAIELVTGEYIALMDHDDLLPAHALYMVAEKLNRHPDADLIYTDEDKIDDQNRRHDPHFKTDWNRELFYSQNIIAHLGVYRSSVIREIGGFRVGFEGSQDYDMALRFIRHTDGSRIRHIPHVLYHWRIFSGVSTLSTDKPNASVDTARRALIEYFAEVEPSAEVVPFAMFPGWWRIKRRLPTPLPRVSLIVPTRDHADVLEVTIRGLLFETDYENLEVIVVDNESVERSTLAYFDALREDPRVKILRVEGDFNFGRLNNLAVEVATGPIIGFINNDLKIIHSDWLIELVTQLVQPNVGAVGAKLYYQNDTIQHSGVILGLYGVAAHGHRHFPRNSIGYFGRPMLVQNVSAVTAACMLMHRHIFEEVGGYSAPHLPVGYNDVDLCLKIREAGYDIVFTPFAELYHLESTSRGENRSSPQIERDMRERAYMLGRWGAVIGRDPFYNPNLTVESEDYALAFPPRAVKPWAVGEGRASQAVRLLPGSERLTQMQQRFDAAYPVEDAILQETALDSSLIAIGVAPFDNIAAIVNELAGERIALGELVVVDGSAEPVRGTAIRDRVAMWRLQLPSTEIKVVPYSRQELRFAVAMRAGIKVASCPNIWIASLDCLPAERCFEYLLKTFIVEARSAIIVSQTLSSNGGFERAEIPSEALGQAARDSLLTATDFSLLNNVADDEVDGSASQPSIMECTSFRYGIFGGARQLLFGSDDVFDTRFITDVAVADLSLRLRESGTRLVQSAPGEALRAGTQPIKAEASWEAIHDWRWLRDKRQKNSEIDVDRVELVCPFHRGDLMLAVQVAWQAAASGIRVRLHTAASLVPWVQDISREIDVEPIPVSIASAERTYPELMAAYLYVSQRQDASPRIARCHPTRGLSETGKNLVAYMMEEAGLPPDSRLLNLKPPTNDMLRENALRLTEPFGPDVVFLHPLGGWSLKSIPGPVLAKLSERVHAAGLKLVQIGGTTDRRVEGCDGAILRDFRPSQWREIFAQGLAIIGVDSWTAHFASILDLPQVTLYGSTHPRHVNSKAWFTEQTSPSLTIGPTIGCSPCNSLACLVFPDRAYCTGYSVDSVALDKFLRSVREQAYRFTSISKVPLTV